MNGVKLSTLKTTTIIFSPINKVFKFDPIEIGGDTLQITEEVKYLGVTLDRHLRWNQHIKNKANAATKLLMTCKSYVGKTWGISPSKLRWIYNQVILPTLGIRIRLLPLDPPDKQHQLPPKNAGKSPKAGDRTNNGRIRLHPHYYTRQYRRNYAH